ncbi:MULTISPECIES: hypothetical protein [Halobacterium]|uniref:hypothetical protein n=1 Tax=Halobacterium TaxID=2239 RepID=UPI00073F266D|nr:MULTISPECIES: hypothetical protein [Halobacterium]MCG1002726.1 hypothetical protein [Halobacterium noricense]
MAAINPDATTEPLADVPERVEGTRLVGVDAAGVAIYFDEADERAVEAVERDGEWVVGDERTRGALEDVVDDIGTLTGWRGLSPFGRGET